MTPKKQSNNVLSLQPETWGERFHRAYRIGRREHGMQYRTIADKVSMVFPTSQTAVIRLEEFDDIPEHPRTRLIAYLSLVTIGFDPADFGLDESNCPLAGYDLARIRSALAPVKQSGKAPAKDSAIISQTARSSSLARTSSAHAPLAKAPSGGHKDAA